MGNRGQVLLHASKESFLLFIYNKTNFSKVNSLIVLDYRPSHKSILD